MSYPKITIRKRLDDDKFNIENPHIVLDKDDPQIYNISYKEPKTVFSWHDVSYIATIEFINGMVEDVSFDSDYLIGLCEEAIEDLMIHDMNKMHLTTVEYDISEPKEPPMTTYFKIFIDSVIR